MVTMQLHGQAREEANVERYRRVFEDLDLDSSGSLDEHEIQAGLQRMGYPRHLRRVSQLVAASNTVVSACARLPSSDKQVHEMMVMVDADKDGSISYGEFASFAQERFVLTLPPARTPEELKF